MEKERSEERMLTAPYDCVIVANGSFPLLPAALDLLHEASMVIACDGAVRSLHQRGVVPSAIVGDLDSIPDVLRRHYADRLHGEAEQDTNDLTKAIHFVCDSGLTEALILGATGLREDHTIGNISLLLEYARLLHRVEMLSDYGLFTPLPARGGSLTSVKGQQISIFTPRPGVEIVHTEGLRWPISRRTLDSWWQGTLNEALGESFTLNLSGGEGVIVYRQHP
ncbi:MAG: thiamine diphosphokinase [Tannerellaceae bacterium]|jgi:thiamine pyrophosphokinase|nr:thiamine diphosphokinase [Tannerellaceae bacterium]